jgi:CheY-like chemotaxis protein
MDTEAGRFRVLLAEDDAVSRDFIGEVLQACGIEVTTCNDGADALATARAHAFDLLIFDQRLPRLEGDAALAALRAESSARTHETPAIATSAAPDVERDGLLQAGFAEVLPKPLSIATLRAALRRHGCTTAKPLDDAAATRACGSRDTLARLRRLFVEQELPKVQDEVAHAADNPQSLRGLLHRLRASCGFCGAVELAATAETLQRALENGDRGSIDAALAALGTALLETRDALRAAIDAA